MPTSRKAASASVFLVGALALAASCNKMVLAIAVNTYQPGVQSFVLGYSTLDNIGLISVSEFWSYIEIGVGMVVACLPSLRVLLDGLPLSLPESWKRSFSRLSLLSSRGTKTGKKGGVYSHTTSVHSNSEDEGKEKSSDDEAGLGEGQIGVQRDITAYAENRDVERQARG